MFLFSVDSMFLATISKVAVSVTPGEPIIWDSAPINPGGHFNTILGMYEVPVHGYYQYVLQRFSCNIVTRRINFIRTVPLTLKSRK